MAETVLDLSLGILPWLAVDARWSLRIADVNPTYTELDASEKLVPNDIHHHDQILVDVTDPWLVARLATVDEGLFGMFRVGLTFPAGRTEQDPYALGREGKSHEHLQAGTGTIVPVVGFAIGVTVARETTVPVSISLGGTGLFSTYDNAEGFRAPSRVYANHRVTAALLDRTLMPFVETTFAHETEEYWQGEPGLEGSNVRSEIYVGGGAAWRFYENWAIDLAARARVATLTHAPTFDTYGVFTLGASTTFDLWSDEPEPEAGAAPPEGPAIKENVRPGGVEFTKD